MGGAASASGATRSRPGRDTFAGRRHIEVRRRGRNSDDARRVRGTQARFPTRSDAAACWSPPTCPGRAFRQIAFPPRDQPFRMPSSGSSIRGGVGRVRPASREPLAARVLRDRPGDESPASRDWPRARDSHAIWRGPRPSRLQARRVLISIAPAARGSGIVRPAVGSHRRAGNGFVSGAGSLMVPWCSTRLPGSRSPRRLRPAVARGPRVAAVPGASNRSSPSLGPRPGAFHSWRQGCGTM